MGRIIDYPEISNFTDEDYLVVDGSEGGTRKILGQAVKGVVDSTPTEDSQNAVSSGGVWNSLNDISEEFQSLRSDAYDVYPKKKLTADVVQFDDGAENVPVSEMTAYIYPSMSGSGMPSRTNVRTISGSNSVNVYHANKNLIAPLTYQDAPETVYLGVENSENLLIFFKAGDYRISVKMRDNSAIVPYWVTSGGTPQRSESMHLDADSEVSIYLYDENGVATIDIESFQVEVGINVTDNETHDGEVTNVAFPSGQGDIYLGRVNPVEGKLLIDAIIYERNSSTMNNDENKPGWSYTGLQTYNVEVGTFDTVVYWPDGTVRFTPVNVGSAYSIEYENDDYNVILPVDSYNMTQSQWISLGINIQILITLSTPIEVDIDPIEFRTFYKNNTYFTNSGKLDVEYRLDLAAYVDNQTDMSDKIEKTYPTDTASGAVATFADGADDIPMKSVKVAIEPVQDLHGYDHPWPAGGGKNLFDGYTANWKKWQLISNVIATRTDTDTGITFTPNEDGTVTVVTTGTYMGIAVEIESSDADRVFSVSGASSVALYSAYENGATRLNVSPTYATISAGVSGCIGIRFDAVGTYTIKCQLESGSTATDYAPYSNICPISGWTGAQVVRTGKNLIPDDALEYSERLGVTFVRNADGTVVINGTSTAQIFNRIGTEPHTLNAGHYVIRKTDAPNVYLQVITPDLQTNFGSATATQDHAFTLTESTDVIYRYIIFANGTYNEQVLYPQLELGSTATDYEPYAGNTYSITFPTEAGTVYGGTLDVTNGVLTVDRAMVDLGTLTWTKNVNDWCTFYSENIKSIIRKYVSIIYTGGICSVYATDISKITANSDNYIYGSRIGELRVKDTSKADLSTSEFKTAMDGVQFCYELSTPTVYTLTPTEIKSLLGDNNVWADAGDTTVTYRADAVMYIDKKLGKDAPMIATDNIVSGSYFMVGSNLYKATANIASGAAVVVGTNATAKTMAEALNEINA